MHNISLKSQSEELTFPPSQAFNVYALFQPITGQFIVYSRFLIFFFNVLRIYVYMTSGAIIGESDEKMCFFPCFHVSVNVKYRTLCNTLLRLFPSQP